MPTEAERNADFPVHVDLGKTPSETGAPVEAPSGDKGDKKKYYPTLYINDAPKELADLPDEGCVLIKYKRRRMSVGTDGDGKQDVSIDLEVQGICLPEDMSEAQDEEGDDGDMESIVDSMAKKSGAVGKRGAPVDSEGDKYGGNEEDEQP